MKTTPQRYYTPRQGQIPVFVSDFLSISVSASNIGYTKARERSQGKGGDLRSKYNLTLTVVRKKYNGRGGVKKGPNTTKKDLEPASGTNPFLCDIIYLT